MGLRLDEMADTTFCVTGRLRVPAWPEATRVLVLHTESGRVLWDVARPAGLADLHLRCLTDRRAWEFWKTGKGVD